MTIGGFSKSIDQFLNEDNIRFCIVGKFEQSLVESDLEAFKKLMQSNVSNIKISILLAKNDYKIGETALWKHRTFKCCCFKKK